MVQFFAAVAAVGIPALVALGSSARRRLSLIRDEVRTLDVLPPDHPSRTALAKNIEMSIQEYVVSRGAKARSRTLFVAYPLLVVGYSVAVFGWGFAAGPMEVLTGVDLGLDGTTRFVLSVASVAIGMGLIGLAMVLRLSDQRKERVLLDMSSPPAADSNEVSAQE